MAQQWCPRSVCKWLVNVYHRECPHSALGHITHNEYKQYAERVTAPPGQLLAVCCGFISHQARLHLRPPEGCLDDSGVMSQIRM